VELLFLLAYERGWSAAGIAVLIPALLPEVSYTLSDADPSRGTLNTLTSIPIPDEIEQPLQDLCSLLPCFYSLGQFIKTLMSPDRDLFGFGHDLRDNDRKRCEECNTIHTYAYTYKRAKKSNAGGVIRTRGLLRDRVLSPAPFPNSATPAYVFISLIKFNNDFLIFSVFPRTTAPSSR
jgi:hypothetical protein